jgi:metal-responsive CopG/Arc/MetJ family transcriptional regulator
MRARIALVIEEKLLERVDLVAGDKLKRSATILKAITEFLEREEAKAPKNSEEIAAK